MMNIWSLYKHRRIKLLLFTLQHQLGHDNFNVEDDDETDYLSIELTSPGQPDIRAYIYIHGRSKFLYGIHLEYPWYSENVFSNEVLVYEGLSMQQVINILSTHFEVDGFEMAI